MPLFHLIGKLSLIELPLLLLKILLLNLCLVVHFFHILLCLLLIRSHLAYLPQLHSVRVIRTDLGVSWKLRDCNESSRGTCIALF